MVRVGFPGGPRLEWYDRNPIPQSNFYGPAGVGPHASTNRSQYTVPTGKKALIMSVQAAVKRNTAPGTPGRYRCSVSCGNQKICDAISHVDTITDGVNMAVGQCGVALAAQTLTVQTEDLSVGGNVTYSGAYGIVEFDA